MGLSKISAGATPRAHIGNRPTTTFDNRTLLIVDDSIDNRAMVRAFLKYQPFAIDEAEDGEAALEKVKARPYDVILMDLLMPKMGGFDAIGAIRSIEKVHGRKRACIVAITAWALTAETLASGADKHLMKPITKAGLLEAVTTV